VHGASTVRALGAVPVFEVHVGAAWVVGFQDLPDENEEIEQPAFAEGLADGDASVTLAQGVALDMRMRCVAVRFCRVALNGHDFIGATVAEIPPVQHDLERPECDSFEFDDVGQHADCRPLQAHRHLFEFVLQRTQVTEDVMNRECQTRFRRGSERLLNSVKAVGQPFERLQQAYPDTSFCTLQLMRPGLLLQTRKTFALDPRFPRQMRDGLILTQPSQPVVNINGSPSECAPVSFQCRSSETRDE
jgi:hypothetical protein